MAAQQTLRVHGYRDLMRSLKNAEKDTKRYVREAFREVGDDVRRDASLRFARYDARTAAGYKTYVRQRGVAVEQSLRKTTGLRPDFGRLQMRKALLPSVADNKQKTEQALDHAIDKVADRFERG